MVSVSLRVWKGRGGGGGGGMGKSNKIPSETKHKVKRKS